MYFHLFELKDLFIRFTFMKLFRFRNQKVFWSESINVEGKLSISTVHDCQLRVAKRQNIIAVITSFLISKIRIFPKNFTIFKWSKKKWWLIRLKTRTKASTYSFVMQFEYDNKWQRILIKIASERFVKLIIFKQKFSLYNTFLCVILDWTNEKLFHIR